MLLGRAESDKYKPQTDNNWEIAMKKNPDCGFSHSSMFGGYVIRWSRPMSAIKLRKALAVDFYSQYIDKDHPAFISTWDQSVGSLVIFWGQGVCEVHVLFRRRSFYFEHKQTYVQKTQCINLTTITGTVQHAPRLQEGSVRRRLLALRLGGGRAERGGPHAARQSPLGATAH